jgi:threonine/homoserine/homoserine lactone efflux protein
MADGAMHPVAAGILTSLSNPYWAVWWATVGLNYITISLQQGAPGLATFYTGHIMSDLLWYSLVAGAVATGRRFMSDKFYRGLIIVCGILLIALGLFFVYSGVF